MIYVEEVRAGMDILYRWLNKNIDPSKDTVERRSFLDQHNEPLPCLI
ncbi:hypothetical protein [Streptococcus acidominimus]|nr:hypothetical protein [Streptococcus acidominimus]MBF0818969.1 hypothetical protein [Streptococcus acidominimus]MBF0837894.1 hypothetical protein [Streptococcus acidominimus]MBF0846073.1 hypothetical protein [Streptococcus danieliae]